MCSKVWSRRISSWDRDVSKLLSEICMHGWKRIKKKWTRLLSKWLILIFIQIRITIRMEKRAQREEKSSATFKLISRISKKFIRRVNSIDTNISNSIKLFQRTTQSSTLSHFNNWLRCSRWPNEIHVLLSIALFPPPSGKFEKTQRTRS